MELNELIPNRDSSWIIRKEYLMVKKLQHIPIAYISDDIVYVFLDAKISKHVIKLVKHLMNIGVEFYMTSPLCSNPSGVENYKEEIIRTYLNSYKNDWFFYGFKKINFDLINNMCNWCKKENCFNLIREIYSNILLKVNSSYYDFYGSQLKYNYNSEIRESFKTIYREIIINYFL